MLILILLLFPLAAAAIISCCRNDRFSRFMLVFTAVVNTVICSILCVGRSNTLQLTKSLCLKADFDGLVIVTLTAVLFLFTAVHIIFWLPHDSKFSGGRTGMSQSKFTAFLLLFLFTMNLTALAQDFGMLWVAVESTTIASAPLINFHKSKKSLEAMWKYLLICSIGIGLALFGTKLIATSLNDPETGLAFSSIKNALAGGNFNITWFKAGFVFFLAGYGLKMGLAPFHTWLPDAYSESSSPVSALLSGALINYSLLAIMRLLAVIPEQLLDFSTGYLKFFGFFSLAVSAFFIIRQKDFKRMLAYSSVEHMGVITLMLAYKLGYVALFHAVIHSLLKMSLFLAAGNILLSYRTRAVAAVKGLFDRLPHNAAAWVFGMLLICGTPPSPLFLTELILVYNAGMIPGIAILLLLLIIFCAMSQRMLSMTAPAEEITADTETDKLAKVPAFVLTLITIAGVISMLFTLLMIKVTETFIQTWVAAWCQVFKDAGLW